MTYSIITIIITIITSVNKVDYRGAAAPKKKGLFDNKDL